MRRAHLVLVSGYERIQILVVQEETLGGEGLRFLGEDARKVLLHQGKNKLDSSFQHSGSIIPEAPRSYLGRRWVSAAERLQSPLPVSRHLGPTDLLGFENHIRSAQAEGCDPRGILPAAHLANLVRTALQRQNPARDERAHNIVGADVSGIVKLLHIPDDPVSFHMALLRIEPPVGSRGFAGNVSREVDEIRRAGVPHIEESLLPGPARFQTGEFVEGAPLAGRDYARPTLNNRFGFRKLLVLNRVDPEIIEAGEGLNSGGETDKPLHERYVGGEVKDGICREMMGLKFIEIEEAPEKV